MSTIDQTKEKMKAGIDHLVEELKKIRTGHANPAMVENVQVETYGTLMRLRDLASITTPEPRQLLITPYDANNANAIGKYLEKANLGFTPIVDGNVVRINIQSMDESVRKDMAKLCHTKREESKISIRNVRREANEMARKQKADGEIGEDILKKLEKEIQDLTDDYCKQADELSEKKEIEVSTV
ncbi:MAG: Ribosome-recycling factor [Chlamydiae bacterium]|nr:Ribosome-recycling factor [Chlamydiota bacterium]